MLAAVSKCKVCVGLLGQLQLCRQGTVLWISSNTPGVAPEIPRALHTPSGKNLTADFFVEILCLNAGTYLAHG